MTLELRCASLCARRCRTKAWPCLQASPVGSKTFCASASTRWVCDLARQHASTHTHCVCLFESQSLSIHGANFYGVFVKGCPLAQFAPALSELCIGPVLCECDRRNFGWVVFETGLTATATLKSLSNNASPNTRPHLRSLPADDLSRTGVLHAKVVCSAQVLCLLPTQYQTAHVL